MEFYSVKIFSYMIIRNVGLLSNKLIVVICTPVQDDMELSYM